MLANGPGIVGQTLLVGLEALPVDIARMHVWHHDLPLISGHAELGTATIGSMLDARPAIDEGAGIARIMQQLENA